jgi:uncharacterized protein (TIGR02145 family)
MMSIALAMAFIISCSDDGNDDGGIEHYGMKKEQFYDERDGKKYAYVKIGAQNWMAENLNYEIAGSRCYGDETGGDSLNTCTTYGRLYKWSDALEVCPEGWRLPSFEDWEILMKYAQTDNDSSYNPTYKDSPTASIAGKYLKAKIGWAASAVVPDGGKDKYGFAALPGGLAGYDSRGVLGGKGSFKEITTVGYWWSSTDKGANAYRQRMSHMGDNAQLSSGNFGIGSNMISIRCVQD